MSMDNDEVVQKVKELRDAVVHHATEGRGSDVSGAEKLGEQLTEHGEQMAARTNVRTRPHSPSSARRARF